MKTDSATCEGCGLNIPGGPGIRLASLLFLTELLAAVIYVWL